MLQIAILTAVFAIVLGHHYFCSDGFFLCNATNKCIVNDKVCNGRNDCSDCADEMQCNFAYPYQTAQRMCHGHQFYCARNRKCISKSLLCDGRDNCGDCSDEYRCAPDSPIYINATCRPADFYCKFSKKCIPKTSLCDEVNDCLDWDDEKRCDRSLHISSTRSPIEINTVPNTVMDDQGCIQSNSSIPCRSIRHIKRHAMNHQHKSNDSHWILALSFAAVIIVIGASYISSKRWQKQKRFQGINDTCEFITSKRSRDTESVTLL